MRFQKGIGYPYPRRPRGPGRKHYHMSDKAYRARVRNAGRRTLVGGKPSRTYEETRRLELEIALAAHRGEACRAIAKRLGSSHIHCWRVARKYRAGLIPMLPPDETGLLALRDRPPAVELEQPFPREPLFTSDNACWRCRVLLYNRARWLCDGCWQLWDDIKFRVAQGDLSTDEVAKLWHLEHCAAPPEPQPRAVTDADERIAERWREVREWKRKNLSRYDTPRRISVPIPR